MKTQEFESKIRQYYSLPEATVINSKSIGYPFYVLSLDLTYLADRDLELLEKFTMKCISNGLNQVSEIATFLGMKENFIEKVLSELIYKDLVQKEVKLKLTQQGLDSLEKHTVSATESETKTFYLDALSGKLWDSFSPRQYKQNQNNYYISKVVKKPRKNHIEDIIDYYEDIEKSLQKPNSNNSNIELIQVNKIEKVYVQWHELWLVTYKSNSTDTELEYEIFSGYSIQSEFKQTIQTLHNQGKTILDPILQDMKQNPIID